MIKHLCGDYCYNTLMLGSEKDLQLRLTLRNQSLLLRKPEDLLDYYIMICERESDNHSIGIGFYSTSLGTSPTIVTDPSGIIYISNGVTLSAVDLKKPKIRFEYQTSSRVYLYKIFSKTILLVEKRHIELISLDGKRLNQISTKETIEFYRFWQGNLWYRTDSKDGMINLKEFGVE